MYGGGDVMRPSELFTQITRLTGLYNIQAIDNIPSIMQRGLLSHEKSSKIRHTSIAMEEVQDRRDKICIPNGMPLHRYANVYFDPRNPMLYVRKDENESLCILKFDRAILDIEGVVVSDRNASSDYASFYQPDIGLRKIDFKLVYASYWTDDNPYEYMRKKSIKCAEVLVPYQVPYEYVVCAAVINETAKQKLENVGFDREIVIEPNMFF